MVELHKPPPINVGSSPLVSDQLSDEVCTFPEIRLWLDLD